MEIYSTYSVKIKHFNNIFKQTVSIYRDAVDFLIAVYLEEWDTLSLLDGRARNNYAECLVHTTKANPDAKYKNFDKKFYKMPTYFIRELTKSLDDSSRLLIEAKVPQCSKRSTCTLSTLISLNAELMSLAA